MSCKWFDARSETYYCEIDGKWDIYFTQVGPIYCGRRRQS
jgi:hypothetical protein